MRVVLCAVAAAVLAGAAAAALPIAKPIPALTLKAEIAAFDAKNYAAAYSAYTPRFKARCPFATFRKHQAAERAQIPGGLRLSVRVTSTRVKGSKAYLAYKLLLAGQVVSTVKASSPDLFVLIGGLWYDELDKQTTC
jgi:hypothetical protein